MNKFNPGDDIWYFTFPEDGCGGFNVDEIDLHRKKNVTKEELTQGYIKYCFDSKESAIGYLSDKIESLKYI